MKYIWLWLIWLAVFWMRLAGSFQARDNLRAMVGKEIRLRGGVASEPILQGSSQRFKVGRVTVWSEQFPKLDYGDKVELTGSLKERAIGRRRSEFSLVYPSVKKISADSGNSGGFRQRLILMRKAIESIYNQVLPEPEASLLAGIVLGAKRGLPKKFWEALQRTGTLHIVVASGYNVTVVIGTMVAYLAGWVKRRTAVVLGIVGVIGYTMMAGAEPAIVRAAIMGSLAYFGQVLGRKADGVRLLLTAAGVMLLWEPVLVWDVGFQLSVGATAGLIFVSPLLGKMFDRVWLVGKDMSETVAAQIAVWPILLITFGQLSAFAVVVNSLILWMVPMVMGLGAVVAMVGWLWLPAGRVVGWLAYGPLTMMVKIIERFGGQSWMSWTVEGVSWWWGAGYYLALALGLIYFHRRSRLDD